MNTSFQKQLGCNLFISSSLFQRNLQNFDRSALQGAGQLGATEERRCTATVTRSLANFSANFSVNPRSLFRELVSITQENGFTGTLCGSEIDFVIKIIISNSDNYMYIYIYLSYMTSEGLV